MAPNRKKDRGNDRPPWLMAFEAQEELSPLSPVEQLLFLIDPIRVSLGSWPARLPRGRGLRCAFVLAWGHVPAYGLRVENWQVLFGFGVSRVRPHHFPLTGGTPSCVITFRPDTKFRRHVLGGMEA